MPTACINQPDCRVHLKSGRLEVFGHKPDAGRDELLREIPLRDLDRLVLTESVQITSHALAALLRAEIPVALLAWNGDFLGGFLPAHNSHGAARLRQYQQSLAPDFSRDMAGRIITAKLYNQRRVLQRLAASRARNAGSSDDASATDDTTAAVRWLDSFFATIARSTSIEELRGHEGAAAARYFQAWAAHLPAAFPFERRSTRPPQNPVNACISFGATILYSEMASFLHAHGLDPALGLLHATENGRWSLALDLMEPFRPVLVEALALDLFTHGILQAAHFESRDGGVFLNTEGRKKFFLQYERRMEREFMSESAGHRTSLRRQLENQAVMLKAALLDPARFEPFLMN
jgi:CRISPR-associated protein Cas1